MKKGSVLMISLWVMAILVVFAVGLGHRAAISLKLACYQRDKLRAVNLAKAGLNKAIAFIEVDAVDPDTKDFDTIKECGINLKGRNLEDIFNFSENNNKDGFKAGYKNSRQDFIFGVRDEESKININGSLDADKKRVLAVLNSCSIDKAAEISELISEWTKQGSIIPVAKKQEFNAPEELLPVLEYFYKQQAGEIDYRKKAQETFSVVRGFITVFPEDKSKVNINTVSEQVLVMLANSLAVGDETNHVLNVSDEIIKLRDSKVSSGQPFKTKTDLVLAQTAIDPADSDSINLFNKLTDAFVFKSQYFQIEVAGFIGRINKSIVAVYNPYKHEIVYWHEN
ncbi:MAG: general secretion pathway protein GspK [Candidatus Omnitrophica bacterium]|nr:general secretion pathway protein GspK [Candidatus Omnitrophota bacterium]